MNFSVKLNALMDLTGTTNSQLAKALNVDPSLVCRWRKNTRSPLNNYNIMISLGNYFSQKLVMPYQKQALFNLMKINPVQNDFIFTCNEIITLWLKGQEINTVNNLAWFNNKLVYNENNSIVKAISALISEGLKNDEKNLIYVMLDLPIRKTVFLLNTIIQNLKITEKNLRKIKSIHIICRQNMQSTILENIIANNELSALLSDKIGIFYLPYTLSVFEHFSFLIEDTGCIVSSAASSASGKVFTITNADQLKKIANEYIALKKKCSTAPKRHENTTNMLPILNTSLTNVFESVLLENLNSYLGDYIPKGTIINNSYRTDSPWLFNYKALFIYDHKGIAQYATGPSEDLWGLPLRDMLSKSAFDMEQSGHFYPSITRLVFEKNEKICALQTTKTGKKLLVVGLPIYSSNGQITKTVNLTSELS